MAEPRDSAIVLQDVSALAQVQYLDRLFETSGSRFGRAFNRIFRVESRIAGGTGFTMQAELGPADMARASNDPLAGIASPTALQATTLLLRWNENTPSSHDFSRISSSCQFSHWMIENADDGAIVDLAKRTAQSVIANYDEHVAVLRNVNRNAVIALVNGTPKASNSYSYASASSTASNSAGLRVTVDNGIFAVLRSNTWIDFINPSTGAVRAGNVRITDKNPGDLSIACEFVTTQFGGRVSTGDLSTVADNDYIVFSGEYNSGMYGPGAWFSTPTAGESFLGGVDRTTANYRWMIPIAPRLGSSTAVLTKSMFDDVAIALGLFNESADGAGLICQTDLTLSTKMRNELGEESFKIVPQSDERMKKFYQFGSTGLSYEHPSLGIVKILGDALCPSNTIRFLDPSSWMTCFYKFKGIRPLGGTSGNWYRVTDSTPNTGNSLVWKSDWACAQQDFCTMPQNNAQIANVSAS